MSASRSLAGLGRYSDEWYTPEPVARVLGRYVPLSARVWFPFDQAKSNFVRTLGKTRLRSTHTHIDDGQDFFDVTPREMRKRFDMVVSNPPFSRKNEILARLFEAGLPFGLLLPSGLFDSEARVTMFKKHPDFQVLYLLPRVRYLRTLNVYTPETSLGCLMLNAKRTTAPTHPPFQSCYLCYKLLPQQIMFAHWRDYEVKT